MHVEAGLLDNIRKFRSSKSELLECTCETTIESWVRKWLTVKGEFRSGVNRSSRGLTILHASARKNIKNLLSLGKKQTTRGTSDGNTQEMMKNTKVSHGEFFDKERNYVVKKYLRRSSKDNALNIIKK
jgi:glutaredoxin 2